MKLLLPLILLYATIASAAEVLAADSAPSGRLIITQFVSAPFPHPSRAAGHRYKDKFFPAAEHYSDSTVAIFVPNQFRQTGRLDCVVHFHGWGNNVTNVLEQFRLVEQFVESGRNAVLVVPQGPRNASDSFGGKLEDADGFKRFMDELIATLKQHAPFKGNELSIGNVILSGHSGGYRVIAGILDRGGLADRVKEVWLFDALYAETDKFLAWQDKQHGRLINICTDNGGTKDDTGQMMATLKQRRVPFLSKHETDATPQNLKRNRLIFLHTDLGHNDVVEKRKQFCQFLKSSCLENARKSPPH